MKTIKISLGGSGKNVDLAQFLGRNDNRLGDIHFRFNDGCTEADAWFVIEEPDLDDRYCEVPPDKVYFLSAETSWPAGHYAESPARMAYLSQFSKVFTCHDVILESVDYTVPFLPWMVNSNHGISMFAPHSRDYNFFRELTLVEKPKKLSIFCSTQQLTPDHRMRLRFVEALKSQLGDKLDWFGNGICSIPEKWDGLAPYRYTIVLENHSSPNIVTEKIQDAFLALSYPIYWGAPNITEYFSADSMTQIDIKDLKGSTETIERLLHEDPYVDKLPGLLQSKARVLNEMHFLHRMARIVNTPSDSQFGQQRAGITIKMISEIEADFKSQGIGLGKRSGIFIERVGKRLQRQFS